MKVFSNESKGLIVFVKNKLISLDSISPILLELKLKSNVSSTIVVFDKLTHDAIDRNVVIKELIQVYGNELYITKGLNNNIIRKIVVLRHLISILFRFIIGAKIIHFGALNEFPLNLIFFFNKKNIFYAQQDSFRHSWSKFYYELGHLKKKSPIVNGENIIAFNDMMEGLDGFLESKNVFQFGETRTRKVWLDYCIKHNNYYLKKFHPKIDFSKGFVVFILSTFAELKSINTKKNMLDLFYETIEALSSISLPVLIKPHVFTDLDIVNSAIMANQNMHITYLHPTILALNSNFFIANTYSTTFADASSLGTSTIEYTNYSDDMYKATNGKSLGYEYVDYFINNNLELLGLAIRDVLSEPKKNNFDGIVGDDSGLLKALSKF